MPIRPENKARYPATWSTEIVPAIAARSGGRCECRGECGLKHAPRCTAQNHLPHPVTGSRVVLTTAHRDHVPENCDPSNLFHACQRCHLAYDRDHHSETRARLKHKNAKTGDLFDSTAPRQLSRHPLHGGKSNV